MSDETRASFEELVRAGGGRSDARTAASAFRSGDTSAGPAIAALSMSVAVAPEQLVEVYDGLCEGFFGEPPHAASIAMEPGVVALSDELADAIWEIVEDPDAGRDPAEITVRTAALTGLLPDAFHERVASMALRYPDVARAAAGGMPPRFTMEQLSIGPDDSLAGALRSLVYDKGFDLEVLDRDSMGLAELPAPLDYLNVRILQCHDIWHLVADYETTGLHEVAISGFQMAQFGHHYSSMFLGLVMAKVVETQPIEALELLLTTTLSAYRHGRESPPLIGVEWESIWTRPIPEIREIIGIRAYDSPYPAGLLEALRSA